MITCDICNIKISSDGRTDNYSNRPDIRNTIKIEEQDKKIEITYMLDMYLSKSEICKTCSDIIYIKYKEEVVKSISSDIENYKENAIKRIEEEDRQELAERKKLDTVSPPVVINEPTKLDNERKIELE
jgi:hypothetical protein